LCLEIRIFVKKLPLSHEVSFFFARKRKFFHLQSIAFQKVIIFAEFSSPDFGFGIRSAGTISIMAQGWSAEEEVRAGICIG